MNLFAWTAEPQEPVNPAKPQREINALAKTIDWVEADLLCMQEVGSLTALLDINSLLKKPFLHVHLANTNSDRGIHLGFMSRYPLRLHSHIEEPLLDDSLQPITDLAGPSATELTELRLQRDIAVAELDIEGQPSLFAANVHLKSAGKRAWQSLSPLTVRTAESRVLAQVITKFQNQYPASPLMVMGDFNDNPSSTAFRSLDNLPGGALFDPLMRELVPANPRLSTYWPKRRSRIDRILLNKIAKTTYRLGSIKLWGNKRAEVASDHFPLSIDLRLDHADLSEQSPGSNC